MEYHVFEQLGEYSDTYMDTMSFKNNLDLSNYINERIKGRTADEAKNMLSNIYIIEGRRIQLELREVITECKAMPPNSRY